MKRCSRCKVSQMQRVREAVHQRGHRRYVLTWYRCPQCQDVGLNYRPVDDDFVADNDLALPELTRDLVLPGR